MEHFVGLDVATLKSAVCVVDREGEIVFETEVETDPVIIVEVLKPWAATLRGLGHEAGALAPWLHAGLLDAGIPTSCLETRHVRASLGAQRNKTDRNDARGIAQLMRTGWFKTIHMKSRDCYRIRLILVHRRTLKRKFLDIENNVRHSLKVFGIKLGHISRGKIADAVMTAVAGDTLLEGLCGAMLAAREALWVQVERLDRLVGELAGGDEVCRRLMGIPGVGPITALTFKTSIETPERFTKSRDVGAYLGLTPRRWQSGASEGFNGGISRRGDGEVRTLLYEAAQSMLTRSQTWSTLKAWGMAQAKRLGHKKAVTAMARRLASIMHAMWRDGTVFQFAPEKWAPDWEPSATNPCKPKRDRSKPKADETDVPDGEKPPKAVKHTKEKPPQGVTPAIMALVHSSKRSLLARQLEKIKAALAALEPRVRDEAIAAASKPMTLKRRGKPPKACPAIVAPPA
jgi:transposase